jgi:hypothetical protein
MDPLTPINSRFIFDNYAIVNGSLTPLNSVHQSKFTTLAQAQAILALVSQIPGCASPTIADNFSDEFGDEQIFTNYRDNTDPTNLLCYAIICTVQIDTGTKDGNGNEVITLTTEKYNVGEILQSRILKGPNSKLTLDKIGQLTFTLPA